MPLIPIDSRGNSLYYEETGPPGADGVYTTLMIVHGTGFHGQIFKRLLPLAPRHQLRLVFINRRDYPGSSPYAEEDLEKIRNGNAEAQDEFAKTRAAEFAQFIKTFVEKENVPKASLDWKRGGVVLMAWSSGNSYTLPLLSYIDTIPQSTREAIEPYLRSLVAFDTSHWILGAPQAPDVLKDSSLTEGERVQHFSKWVSSYYKHRSLTSRNIADLQLVPVEPFRKSTIESMSAQDVRETTHYAAVLHSEVATRAGNPSVYAERIRRALFDDELVKYLPRVGVDVVWCENSTWAVVDGIWEFQKAREEADENGIVGRPLSIIMMPGTNHFPHWDEPEATMEFFSNVVNP